MKMRERALTSFSIKPGKIGLERLLRQLVILINER